MSDMLIANGAVLTMDDQGSIYQPGWLWIHDRRIGGVGAGQPPDSVNQVAARVIDATGMAVLPGFVNGHTHLEQILMRGVGDGRPMMRWLQEIMWPMEWAMTPEDMYLAARLSMLEYLKSGVTAVVQHHKVTRSPEHLDAAAQAGQDSGIRLLLHRMWSDLGQGRESADEIIRQMDRLRAQWQGAAGGRITVGFGPSVPWRCFDETLRQTLSQARAWGLPTHIHAAEELELIASFRQQRGKSPIEWLDSLGALGPDVQLVHCIFLEDSEMDLIAGSGSVVVHCPISNAFLGMGTAPVRKMLERGIPVALGTDASGTGGSQDMLETIKVAVLMAKLRDGDPCAMLPYTGLAMATRAGARLLGRDDIGRLVPGAAADLSLVRLHTLRAVPTPDPASAVVYSAIGPDVQMVMVDGQVLVEDGRASEIDEESLLDECLRAAVQLRRRAGIPDELPAPLGVLP